MFIKLKVALESFIERKLIVDGIGERTRLFIGGFRSSVLAAVISRVVTGLTTLQAARILGPAEYGEANLTLAITLWIQIPMFLGIHTSLIHYVSRASEAEKPKYLAQGTTLMSWCMGITLLFSFLLRGFWADVLHVPVKGFVLALVWTSCYWVFVLLKSVLNALEKFNVRSTAEILFAICFPITFFLWMRWGFRSGAYIMGLSIPYALVGLGGLLYLRFSWRHLFSFGDKTKKIFTYGILCTSGGVVAALFDSPARLIMNRNLGLSDVGVLSAYQAGSTQMALFLLMAFSQVFFPIASRTPDKRALFRKLNRVFWPAFPLIVLAFAAMLTAYLLILGRNYRIEPILCVIFSLAGAASLISGILIWFVGSYGPKGIILSGVIGISTGLINLMGCHWAIPRYRIAGAGVAYLVASALGILVLYIPAVQRWLNKEGVSHAAV